MKDIILLDSNSNSTILCNPKLLNKFWNTNDSADSDINGRGKLACAKRLKILYVEKNLFNSD